MEPTENGASSSTTIKAAAKREREDGGARGSPSSAPLLTKKTRAEEEGRDEIDSASFSGGFSGSSSNAWAAATAEHVAGFGGGFGGGFAGGFGGAEGEGSGFSAAWGQPSAGAGAGWGSREEGGASSREGGEGEGGEGEGEGENEGADEEAHNRALLSAGAEGASGPAPPALPLAGPALTGEEEDVTLLQLRGKLFVLAKGEEGRAAADSAAGSVTGGPRLGAGGLGDRVSLASPAPAPPTAGAGAGRWRECGTGPLRLSVRRDIAEARLKAHLPRGHTRLPADAPSLHGPPVRLIMRQEMSTGSSHGGRLLLNAPVHAGFALTAHPLHERAVQFSAVGEGGGPAAYLLRLATAAAAGELVAAVGEARAVVADGRAVG